jgi:hypothetical protein
VMEMILRTLDPLLELGDDARMTRTLRVRTLPMHSVQRAVRRPNPTPKADNG